MPTRRFERAMFATSFVGACVVFERACVTFGQANGAVATPVTVAQATIVQQPETSVSPTTLGTLPGTTAGPDTSVGANPVTGQPCLGSGSSAINGGIIGAPTTAGQPSEPGTDAAGLPPNNSVYSLNNGTAPGSC